MKIVRLKDLGWVPAGHENPQSPGVLKKVLLQKADLGEGDVQMVNWCRMPPGRSFHPHYHEDMAEIFVILAGKARIRVEAEEADMGKEEACLIPAGRVHEMKNAGEEDLDYIALGISRGKGGKTVLV